jgi:cellulose biosynthesis protein BcsQ
VKRIAVYNIKGGVGKTTTSVNLACLLARQGLSVLLWDLDAQGGSSYFFQLQHKNAGQLQRLFDKRSNIYDLIQSTGSYQIDVIANDSEFCDLNMQQVSRMTALSYTNFEIIDLALHELKDDFDVCIVDCPPGKSLLHENVFRAMDLMVVPNIPAPLSIYCNEMLLELLSKISNLRMSVLSFYNMVQVNKKMHHQYVFGSKELSEGIRQLNNYIPFYSEIEQITATRQSIFHQLKAAKSNAYYQFLWQEICEKMQWPELIDFRAHVISLTEQKEIELADKPTWKPLVNKAI